MPSCNSTHRRRHFYPFRRFQPYILRSGDGDDDDFLAATLSGMPWGGHHRSMLQNKVRIIESDSAYTALMDVPGVKVPNVTVEEKDGEIEITAIRMNRTNDEEVYKTYQDIFYVDPAIVDPLQTQANLKNGVLTITVPKKPPVQTTITIEDAYPPSPPDTSSMNDSKEEEFRFAMDLPGVHLNDLSVEFHRNSIVTVSGKRNVGNRIVEVERSLEVRPSVDMTQAKAYLQDGVFTLIAPTRCGGGNAISSDNVRIIPVNEDNIPTVASLSLDDKTMSEEVNSNDDKEEDVMVETAETEKDWEKIEEN